MKIILLAILAAVCYGTLAEKARFDNYRVYSLLVENEKQVKLLREIEEHPFGFSFWNNVILGQEVNIMVPPHKQPDFEELIQLLTISYKLQINNVQELIDNERPKQRANTVDWKDYNTLDEIYNWMDIQIKAFPNILTNQHIGTSHQGRPIRGVKIAHKAGNPLVIIESNIHAREWITSATATWLINELLTSKNPAVQDLAQNINWLIIPVLNVDGYVFSHTTNRMWRKTRQPHSFLCSGADANRNFDFKWMLIGASSNPCSETYAGPRPFSEPESRQLADFVGKVANQTKIYLSFHSFGQYFMFPYGHTRNPTDNYNDLMSIGNKTTQAIAVRYGTDYIYGQSSRVLYETSGSSVDWAFDEHNIKLGLIFEFRDRRGGRYGFILPASQIIPNSLEILDGLIALVKEARALNQL